MKKILALIITVIFTSSMVFAKDSVTHSDNLGSKDMTIHTLKIFNSNFGPRMLFPTLQLGIMINGYCRYSVFETIPAFPLAGNSYTYFNIWGDIIAQKYGVGYNCSLLTIQTDMGQYAHDDFFLYNNGYMYTAASPNYAETYFNAIK